MHGQMSPDFLNPAGAGLMEIGSVVVYICLFIYLWRECKRAGTLTFGMLLLLSSTTMFWQEFYADWGAYLLYNPVFKLMPWGSTKWTTPNKPWFMPFSYGWFYYGAMVVMLELSARLRARRPDWGHTTCVFLVATPFFFLYDVALELPAALVGWWSYVYYFGPGLQSTHGNFPLIYPVGWYAFSGFFMCWLLSYRGDDGRVAFESFFGVNNIRHRYLREAARVGIWSLAVNVVYLTNTAPVIAVREMFGIPNPYVP